VTLYFDDDKSIFEASRRRDHARRVCRPHGSGQGAGEREGRRDCAPGFGFAGRAAYRWFL